MVMVIKAKKNYYNNLDHKNAIDKKTSWKSFKSLLSGKSSTYNKIWLVHQSENGKSNQNIPKYHDQSVNVNHLEDLITRSIE